MVLLLRSSSWSCSYPVKQQNNYQTGRIEQVQVPHLMPTDTRSSSKARAARVGAVWVWVWPGDPRYWLTFVYLLSALARNVSLYLVACNLYLLLSVAVYSPVCLSLFAFRNLTKIPFILRSTISVCLMFFRDSVIVLFLSLFFLFLVFGFCFLRYLLSRFLPLFLSKRFFLWLRCLPFCVRQADNIRECTYVIPLHVFLFA